MLRRGGLKLIPNRNSVSVAQIAEGHKGVVKAKADETEARAQAAFR